MIVLAIDTARAQCAGALLSGDRLTIREEPMAKGQAERLIPLLEEMLAEVSLAWGDLGALGVGIGPGNFTGTRIAVAAARGLALGLGIPAVGVSAFEVLASLRPDAAWRLVPGPLGATYAQGRDASEPVELSADEVAALDGAIASLDDLAPGEAVATIARLAALRADEPGLPRPAPLYLRPADALPPRDPAPMTLPG